MRASRASRKCTIKEIRGMTEKPPQKKKKNWNNEGHPKIK